MDKEIKTIAICASHVPFFKGGAEEHVNTLANELKKRGHEVDIINVPYKWYPKRQLFNSIKIWGLLDLRESNGKKIDLVIATKFPSYFINHDNKVLWLIHQYRQIYDLYNTPYSEYKNNLKGSIIRKILQYKDTKALLKYKKIFTNSRNTANRLKKFNKIDSTHLYHPPRLYDRYYTDKYKDFVLSVGRLDKIKRIDLLIKAIKYTDSRILYKVAGTGPEKTYLKNLAKSENIEHRIEFMGYISDEEVIALYANCFATFFAPVDEDYGYITLESFLSKKPVITGEDSGGPLEFVEDGVNGHIIYEINPKSLGEKINLLFKDKAKCKKMGENGYNKVKDINWDHVIKSLLER